MRYDSVSGQPMARSGQTEPKEAICRSGGRSTKPSLARLQTEHQDQLLLSFGPQPDAKVAGLDAVLSAKEQVEVAIKELSESISRLQAGLSGPPDAPCGDLEQSEADGEASHSASCSPQDASCKSASGETGGNFSDRRAGRQAVARPSEYQEKQLSPTHGTSATNLDHQVNAETLPDTWPRSLEIRWEVGFDAVESSHILGRVCASKDISRFRNRRDGLGASGSRIEESRQSERKSCFVVHPNSRGRLVFELVGAAFLAFDCFMIPFMVAWDVPMRGWLLYTAWLTAIFWSVDIGVSGITAFHRGDGLVVDFNSILWRYIKSWFWPDLAIVLCDWMSLMVESTSWRTMRLVKIGRMLRLVALFRLVKMASVFSEIIEDSFNSFQKMGIKFAKMAIITITYAHFISCIWFFIGRGAPSDTGRRWIDGDFDSVNTAYQYSTSFHWAMSQITLGAMEVSSSNLIERVYSILCMLGGLLFGTTLVSLLSASMLETQMDQRENHLKMVQMRRYLRENQVRPTLAFQMERQLQERLASRDKIKEDQVVGLALLSSSLRSQLRFDLFTPHLKRHPLFHMWMSVDATFVERFCSTCMDSLHLRTQDDLFLAGKTAECAYFFIEGIMTYTQEPESSPVTWTSTRTLEPGCWITEAALWSHWIHVGAARATRFCEVVQVHAVLVMEVLQRTTTVIQLARDYCHKFHRRLQAAKPPITDWPDDLHVPLTDWTRMVLALDMESQVIIGLESIRQATLGRAWKRGASGLDKLTEEVQNGKSTVMLNSDGEMERVASVVALKICNDRGQMFIQIGKMEEGRMKPACQLPGAKQERGEISTDTVERLLETKMAPFEEHIGVTHIKREVQVKESKEYGVRTKYLRNVVHAELQGNGCKLSTLELDDHDFDVPGRLVSKEQTFRGSSREVEEDAQWEACLRSRDVFRIQDNKGGQALYAWFTEQEFDQLKGPIGENMLPGWLFTLGAALDRSLAGPDLELATEHRATEGHDATPAPDADDGSFVKFQEVAVGDLAVNAGEQGDALSSGVLIN